MSDPLHRAVLELNANVVSDTNGRDEGVFEMVGDLEIEQGIEVGHTIASGQGSMLNAVISSTVDEISDLISSDEGENTKRAGFHLDLGAGKHTMQINFNGWKGATDSEGNPLQWGNTGDSSQLTEGDATGADPMSQIHCFTQYLRIGEYDSRYPHGRLRFGEYCDGTYNSSDGMYDDYIQVAIKRANFNRVSEDPQRFDGSIYLEETLNWTEPIEAIGKIEW